MRDVTDPALPAPARTPARTLRMDKPWVEIGLRGSLRELTVCVANLTEHALSEIQTFLDLRLDRAQRRKLLSKHGDLSLEFGSPAAVLQPPACDPHRGERWRHHREEGHERNEESEGFHVTCRR